MNDINCAHACRNTCVMLKEAVRKEAELAHFYERLIGECDYPDVHAFLIDCSDKHRSLVDRLIGKLNEMNARSQALDGVISSFDPAGV